MLLIKYGVELRSINTKFIAYTNGIKAISNIQDNGEVIGRLGEIPMTVGMTISAYLENGINEVSFDIGPFPNPSNNNNYLPNAECTLTITNDIYDTTSDTLKETEILRIIGSLDENLKPTAELSPNYKEGLVKGHAVEGTEFYRISRNFKVNDLPDWKWTKATPFEPTDDNMQKLRNAYLEVWQTIEHKNEQKFQDLSFISFKENKEAAFYPGSWYKSLGLDEEFKDSTGAYPINWDEYKLVSFCNGRLIKLENEYKRSPLGFKDDEGDLTATYNPFFSLIDDKLLITR